MKKEKIIYSITVKWISACGKEVIVNSSAETKEEFLERVKLILQAR